MSTSNTTLTPCPVCGSQQAEPIARVDGKTGEPLLTVNCSCCGLGRIDPLPTRQELAAWYTHRYRQDYKQAASPALRHVLRAGRHARDRWAWLQSHFGSGSRHLPTSSVTLDIGASSGEFVDLMRQRGMQAHGIEPHAGYATFARERLGLSVEHGALHRVLPDHADQHYGLISMFHVLEHLVDPVETLQLLAQKASPGGHLLIEVPNATRFCAPSYMFFRAHTLYFTQTSLHQTLQAGGWNVVAHNHADDDNLMVLARPAPARGVDHVPMHWQPGRALIEAQNRRTWPAYLADQLQSGRWLLKLRQRQEEKQTVRDFSSARSLLDALYQDDSQLNLPKGASPRQQSQRAQTMAALGVGLGLGTFLEL